MRAWRQLLVLLTILGLIALIGPAAAFASGPSAGDQQYVDPLGGSHTGSQHSGGGGSSPSTGTSSPTTAPAAPSSSATVSSSSTTTTASVTPTPTTASSTATAGDPAKTLPRTGFDAWLAVVIGLGMFGSGLALRRVFARGE